MINLYGIFISLSIIIPLIFAESILLRNETAKVKNLLWETSLIAIISGFLGARLYHVIDYWEYYSQDIVKIAYLREGGLGIWGALIFGSISVILYLRIKKQNILYWLDVFSILLPLGQSIGRWGNFFNKELFGLPTNLMWGMYVPTEYRPTEYYSYSHFHPLFVYESILCFLLFILLFILNKHYQSRKYYEKYKKGTLFIIYLSSYSLIRGSLDFFRINPWKISGLNVSQLISILTLVSCLILFICKYLLPQIMEDLNLKKNS